MRAPSASRPKRWPSRRAPTCPTVSCSTLMVHRGQRRRRQNSADAHCRGCGCGGRHPVDRRAPELRDPQRGVRHPGRSRRGELNPLPDNAILITGANTGLGKDVARQLLCATTSTPSIWHAETRSGHGLRTTTWSRSPAGPWNLAAAMPAQRTITGALVDQAGIIADFADETIEDHAHQAIHEFLRISRADAGPS